MIRLVTFCDESMARSACLCVTSSREHGAEESGVYTFEQLKTTDFYRENKALLDQPRGLGFWAWKPYVILDLMHGMADGEFAIYIDAGVKVINNLKYIIDRMDQDIWLFGNEWPHAWWCKRDIIEAIMPLTLDDAKADPSTNDDTLVFGDWWMDRGWSRFGKQAQASVIAFRVNDYTRAFVKEWLDWCLFDAGRLVDDSPSRAPNHPDFRENRYDQAILTTMAYRDGIKLHGWFVRYPTFEPRRVGYESDNYPTLFLHHRWRNHEWQEGVIT